MPSNYRQPQKPIKRGGEVSKSELRRLEIVAPEAIKQLREQIAREIEICEPCFNDVWCGKDEKNQDCSCICHQYAAIARGEK